MKRAPLPLRDGVGPSCVALPADAREGSILHHLVRLFPAVSAGQWAERVAAGEVRDEQGAAVTALTPARPHLRVYYYRSVADEPAIPFEAPVLYQDEHLVVADKPHFLPVTPGGRHLQQTLLVRLRRQLGLDDLAPLHRLDRETAGLVMFSVQVATRGVYQRLFAERRLQKAYECIAPWRPELPWPLRHRSRVVDDPHFMRMREVPGEPNSETLITPLEVQPAAEGHGLPAAHPLPPLARYRLEPLTGRRHQLRVHCLALGLPILGDTLYPVLLPQGSDDPALPLQLLARSLCFDDPLTGQPRRFESTRRLQALPQSRTLAAAGSPPAVQTDEGPRP